MNLKNWLITIENLSINVKKHILDINQPKTQLIVKFQHVLFDFVTTIRMNY